METMAGTAEVLDVRSAEDDRAWARIGRIAAYVAGRGASFPAPTGPAGRSAWSCGRYRTRTCRS